MDWTDCGHLAPAPRVQVATSTWEAFRHQRSSLVNLLDVGKRSVSSKLAPTQSEPFGTMATKQGSILGSDLGLFVPVAAPSRLRVDRGRLRALQGERPVPRASIRDT